eukprot:comp113015_c0_seq1/m.48871 comp113015_c0_seq1/g.48871  ORF comp113015_c0_seq1/g.48871 comp113015_c0_seq1/m.48871 type:complete len:251 (-) comp113015_c0_seq1:392-1144(-)
MCEHDLATPGSYGLITIGRPSLFKPQQRQPATEKQKQPPVFEPPRETGKQKFKREFSLKKRKDVPFGASLCYFRCGIYVTYVEPGSYAWCLGIEIGDRIDVVNEAFLTERFVPPQNVIDVLRSSDQVEISVTDSPLFVDYTLQKSKTEQPLGLSLEQLEIMVPSPGTACAEAHMEGNRIITHVDGKHVLEMSSLELTRYVEGRYQTGKEVTLTTCPAKLGKYVRDVFMQKNAHRRAHSTPMFLYTGPRSF